MPFDRIEPATYGCQTFHFGNNSLGGRGAMRNTTINGRPVGQKNSGHVISRSAILILSGLLIGTAIAQGDLAGVAFYRFVAGIIGLIAFYALDLAAQRRQTRVVRKRLAAADSVLTRRLRRHVPVNEVAPPCRKLRSIGETSYLPVTGAKG